MLRAKIGRRFSVFGFLCLLMSACQSQPPTLDADQYFDQVYGAWQAIMVANHTGLQYEGQFIDAPSSDQQIELALLDQWATDDDTAIEWVNLHILETYGLDPTYEQIRDEWVDHLNHDIWVSTLRARELMDEGHLPPDTGSSALNPDGAWSIDAMLETELFGLIAPNQPAEAQRRARYFARVTNSGLAVEASAFYAHLYAEAFSESSIPVLITSAKNTFTPTSQVYQLVTNVETWHAANPKDWRKTRQLIHITYDDPSWWAAKVNFASTIMALLYGKGDLIDTMTITGLAGWDADNNMTTAAGLLGIISGYNRLPLPIRNASDIYFNEDVTGDLPKYDSVKNIALRTTQLRRTD